MRNSNKSYQGILLRSTYLCRINGAIIITAKILVKILVEAPKDELDLKFGVCDQYCFRKSRVRLALTRCVRVPSLNCGAKSYRSGPGNCHEKTKFGHSSLDCVVFLQIQEELEARAGPKETVKVTNYLFEKIISLTPSKKHGCLD